MDFSLSNYQKKISDGSFQVPSIYSPYKDIDRIKYHNLEKEHSFHKKIENAISEARQRTTKNYYQKAYPLQAKTLDYSYQAFPCYKFILPEIIKDDWLAIVDSHKFQRDHVLHQPLTGYVVLELLNFKIGSKTILEKCVKHLFKCDESAYLKELLIDLGMDRHSKLLNPNLRSTRMVWKELFKEAAYVAAIFHDLGYPWQYIGLLSGHLTGFNHSGTGFHQNAQDIIDAFQERLIFYPFRGYKKMFSSCPVDWATKLQKLVKLSMEKSHGFPGALGFLYLNDMIRIYPKKSETPLRIFMNEWIATAIMMHDMKKIYWGKGGINTEPENPQIRADFSKDPLSAIITLADVIQDFERPTAFFTPEDKNVDLKYLHATKQAQVTFDSSNNNLNIHYVMKNREALAIKNNSLIEERKEYFDQKYGYLDLTGLGIHKVTMSASMRKI